MILFFSVIFLILFVLAIIVLFLILFKTKKNSKNEYIELLQDILDRKAFYPKKIIMIDTHFFLSVNKSLTRLAIIQNFNSKSLKYNYEEIALQFLTGISQISSKAFKVDYVHKGEKKTFLVHSKSKEVKEFIYSIYKVANVKRIKDKFLQCNFSITSTSDFENTYVWAYSPSNSIFAYFKTKEEFCINKLNLLKNYFTIDVKYNYFEVDFFGEKKQLIVYDNIFLQELFQSMYQNIKQRTAEMSENLIYYDDYSRIIYISNGVSSLQSILLNNLQDVLYKENKLCFIQNDDSSIVFPASNEFIKEFEDFVIGFNLRKIANSFDYKFDKLINITSNTKLIIDFSRDRIVYCANLNSFLNFNYVTISFSNIEDINIEKSGSKGFVRIYTKDKEIIDISCNKLEIAHYILGQVNTIINS